MDTLEIVLEPDQHQALIEIARCEGRSISDLVREILEQYLTGQDREVQTQREIRAIGELTQIRRQIQEQHGVYGVDPVAKVREERDQDMKRVWKDEA
jgi:hypothetical protein